ncbi:MAG: phosphoribosylglycinamide formyltransferase, partial [Alistipes sp.]|nr:phosphoribosylglycinamide formyltransferase [Alistipes sp.]
MRRIAIFASGEGTNFEAIAAACRSGRLDAEVVLAVCDRPG